MPKKFAVVAFPLEGDSIAVVPLSWVTADNEQCLWPPGSADMRHLALTEAVPGTTDEGWQCYPIRIVAKCPPAPPVSVSQCATASHQAAEVRQQVVAEEQEAVPEPEVEQQCQATGNLPSEQEELGTSAAGGLAVDPEQSGSPDVANNLLLRTIRLLVEVRQEQRQGFSSLRAEMQQLSARLDSMEALLDRRGQPVSPAARPRDIPELPATSLEELEAAEAALEDKDVASALQDHLARLGGRELREVAVNVLTAIMTNSVQRLFSMHGKKGKREFAALRLCKVATDVISRKAGVDIATVEAFIKKWLPGSADRGDFFKH
ncbi:hypothetical protein HPB52_002841 [Rhipicephalus sanguineus]|uniref:DUF4806 domain-containing protein n=1 Tax=Rhipicephalus sanguineus TaxID=34632 RepID=A0A9D4SXG3_RHISA|nr:hypothetical protein HPB52_002841 [Rhipicephalus sanguineus]